MNIIDLHTLRAGQAVSGLVFIQAYQKKLDDSKRPLYGTLALKGYTIKFKIWEKSIQNVFNAHDVGGHIVFITGTATEYNGSLEITVETVNFEHGFTDVSVFIKSADVDGVFQKFASFINTNLSTNGVALVSEFLKQDNYLEEFKYAWAAMKMHDAQVGGLMNHTYKMLNIAKTLVENDARLEEFKDIIFIGIILHDLGKIIELDNLGKYTTEGFVGHRTLAVEMVARQKELFLKYFDAKFYYHILEIITGHHGSEYGDEPKTVWAYIIHLIDMLESQTTGMIDAYASGSIADVNGNKAVWNHGKNLVI